MKCENDDNECIRDLGKQAKPDLLQVSQLQLQKVLKIDPFEKLHEAQYKCLIHV
jgi:hypothetical protein